jgi:hypothetical protein
VSAEVPGLPEVRVAPTYSAIRAVLVNFPWEAFRLFDVDESLRREHTQLWVDELAARLDMLADRDD